MTSPSVNSQRRAVAAPDGGRRRHRSRQHPPTTRVAGPPDLAAAAREAVVSFLHDSSVATAEREGGRPAGAGTDVTPRTDTAQNAVLGGESPASGVRPTAQDVIPWSAATASSPVVAESATVRAAAVSVATLERIESVAAKVEADIAAALRAHAELQAGAGAAAAAAVRAAQAAWTAAETAVDADVRAKISLRKVARYVTVTIALLMITLVVLGIAATSAH
jgi:hypothetical protein